MINKVRILYFSAMTLLFMVFALIFQINDDYPKACFNLILMFFCWYEADQSYDRDNP